MQFKLHFTGRIVSIVVDEAGETFIASVVVSYDLFVVDKINQWGHEFRDSYNRLGLLKPFMAEDAGIFFLTATATAADMKVEI